MTLVGRCRLTGKKFANLPYVEWADAAEAQLAKAFAEIAKWIEWHNYAGMSDTQARNSPYDTLAAELRLEAAGLMDLKISRAFGTGVMLSDLDSKQLTLKEPVYICWQQSADGVLVECDAFEEYGWGKTYDEALADLRSSIVELYFALKGRLDRLGKPLLDLWKRYQDYTAEGGRVL